MFPSRNYYSGSKYFSSKIFNNIAIKKWGKKNKRRGVLDFWLLQFSVCRTICKLLWLIKAKEFKTLTYINLLLILLLICFQILIQFYCTFKFSIQIHSECVYLHNWNLCFSPQQGNGAGWEIFFQHKPLCFRRI